MAKEPGLSRGTGAPRQGAFFAIDDTADRQRSVSRPRTQATGQPIAMSAGQSVPKTTRSMPTVSISMRRAASLGVGPSRP